MRQNKIFILLLIILDFIQIAHGQDKLKFSDFTPLRNDLSPTNYFQEMSKEMQLSEDTEMKFMSVFHSLENIGHYRYQQYYKTIPVIGNTYILHEKNGIMTRGTGLYTPNISINISPSISAKSAINKSKQLMLAEINKKNVAIDLTRINTVGEAKLCLIDNSFPRTGGNITLAYQVDLQCDYPLMKMRYYIDANSSRLINSFPLIQQHGVPGLGKTRYYSTQQIIIDSVAPNDYVLKDITRGRGITVKNNSGELYHNNSTHWDLTNAKRDEVAIDAMYCSEKYFDLLSEKFDWESLDGEGTPINITLHNNAIGAVNAYWDGASANIGDGNCSRGPLSTLDVMGHEFTHGLIQYTSQMIYSGESGAINESIADMFGKSLEYYADPARFTWHMGKSIHLKPGLLPFRMMDDPNQMGMPAFYKGLYWVDDNEVHINSSIGNLWFVMLSDGRSGINEANENFNVTGIGIEKAHSIIFLANNAYNISNTNYFQFAKNTLLAAEELYGVNSPEWLAVQEAWKAVGVNGQINTKKDLAITSPSDQFNTCEINDYLPLTIQVTNFGSETYVQNSGAFLSLYSLTNGTRTIPLPDDILPDETKTFEVNDWIRYVGQSYESYNLNVVYDDEYPDNNGSLIFVNYHIFDQQDLSVNISKSGDVVCKGGRQMFLAGIMNNSCEEINTGEQVQLIFRDENGVSLWSKEIILEESIPGGSIHYEELEVELDFSDIRTYSIELNYTGDPDVSNNSSVIELSPSHSLETNYFQGFDNLPDDLGELSIFSLYPYPTINYLNSTYLGFTGYYPDTSVRERCGIPEDAFITSQKLIAYAWLCINFTSEEDVTVEFDAILFKNRFNEEVNYPYSCMIQVAWEGNESGSELIYDQEDGVKVHHSIELPPYFGGTLYFKFFTETGNLTLDQFAMQNNDVILMDNLDIHTGKISENKTIDQFKTSVFPNPCTQYLNLDHFDIEQTLEIIDIMGRVTMKGMAVNNKLDVSSLIQGIYFLKMVDKSGAVDVVRFVKI